MVTLCCGGFIDEPCRYCTATLRPLLMRLLRLLQCQRLPLCRSTVDCRVVEDCILPEQQARAVVYTAGRFAHTRGSSILCWSFAAWIALRSSIVLAEWIIKHCVQACAEILAQPCDLNKALSGHMAFCQHGIVTSYVMGLRSTI